MHPTIIPIDRLIQLRNESINHNKSGIICSTVYVQYRTLLKLYCSWIVLYKSSISSISSTSSISSSWYKWLHYTTLHYKIKAATAPDAKPNVPTRSFSKHVSNCSFILLTLQCFRITNRQLLTCVVIVLLICCITSGQSSLSLSSIPAEFNTSDLLYSMGFYNL